MKALCLFALVSALLFWAGDVSADSLDNAHRAFAAGDFHTSTQDYQAILEQKGYSAPVLFDLGNSLYREGDFPGAIVAYSRAQWLAPGDSDITANLQLARKQAGLPAIDPVWTDKIDGFLSGSTWAWIGSGAWFVLCAGLLARTAWPQKQGLLFLSNTTAVLVLATAIAGFVISSDKLNEAIVVDKKAVALISPFPAAQVVFSPAAGETVTVEKTYDDFLFVKDQAGHTGWVDKSQVAPIIPAQRVGPS
jgi:tetratricopeptide (TPR) repeat protein